MGWMDTGSPSNRRSHLAAAAVLRALSGTGWTASALLEPANLKGMGRQRRLQIFRQRWCCRGLLWQQEVMEVV